MADAASAPIPLPENPSLEWLGKEAKRCLQELRQVNPVARLADAQFEVARRYGFSSWRALKAHVDSLTLEGEVSGAVVHLEIETEEIYGAAFSPDLTRLLTGAQGNPIQHG